MHNLRRSLILLISLIIIFNSKPQVEACGWSPSYLEGYLTFFQSDLANDPLFKRYAYDFANQQSQYQYDESLHENRSNLNLFEWEKFFEQRISLEGLSSLIYQLPSADLQKIIDALIQGKKRDFWQVFTKKDLPALNYLIFAKECEPYVTEGDSWYFEPEELEKKRQPEPMQKLMTLGEQKYQAETSKFLKLRYGYQLVRLAHYAKKYQACLKYYQQMSKLATEGIVLDWSFRHQLGAMRKSGIEAEALVQSSIVFDQKVSMMDEAYLDFSIPSEAVWQQMLQLTSANKHRQATLWFLRGLDEERFVLESLKEIYALEPKSSRLEVLLVRLINHVEREYLTSAVFFKTKNQEMLEQKQSLLKYAREIGKFIESVDKTKVHQPALWYASLGYLEILQQNPQKAEDALFQAQQDQNAKSNLKQQIRLLQSLNLITAEGNLNSAIEEYCCDPIVWLDSLKDVKSNFENLRQSFYALLGQKYFAQGDLIKGYCAMAKADCKTDELLTVAFGSKDLDQLIAFMSKLNQTRFEKLLNTNSKYSIDDLYFLKGTNLLRAKKFPEALTSFEQVSNGYWQKLREKWDEGYYGQIRTSFVKNYYNPKTGLYAYPKQGFTHYTKLDFTSQVVKLQKSATTDPKQADRYYYQIANGFFHSPFWAYHENLLGSSGIYTFELFDFEPYQELKKRLENDWGWQRRKIAMEYYVKAALATRDSELAAECIFMAAACKTRFSWYDEFNDDGKEINDYFKLLKDKYAETKYYQRVVQECATLKDYLGKK